MALTQAQVNQIYNDVLGRNALFGDAQEHDADYWLSGHTYDEALRGIQSGSEAKNIAALKVSNPEITDAEIDKMVLPGGWKTEHHSDYGGGSLFDFNEGNTWMNSTGTGNDWAKAQNAVNQGLGISASNDWNTIAGPTGGGGVIDGSTLPVDTDTGTDTVTDTGTGSNYLTSADLTSWWDSLDKPWLTQTEDTTANTSGNDDFMKMMMFMAMMRPQGGGGGFGQYGYGGLNPGGVQSAYNPLANLSGYMDAFKNLPGLSTGNISTGSN